ncbi:MAG: glycoside hydrolase family 65 protein [Actinomycetes bacterium]
MVTGWSLVFDGLDLEGEKGREALCTLGNGYFATRGAGAEATAGAHHYPGTYVAGCYNRLTDDVEGRLIENESLVNLPNWLLQRVAVDDGGWFAPTPQNLDDYRQELDLRRGVLDRRLSFTDAQDRRTALVERRIVHMRDPHIAASQTTVTAVDWSGRLRIETGIDGEVANTGVDRYRRFGTHHLLVQPGEDDGECLVLEAETLQSRIRVAMAARLRVLVNGERSDVCSRTVRRGSVIARELQVDVTQGDTVTVEKVVAVFTTRDRAIAEPRFAAVAALAEAGDFEQLLSTHVAAWDRLWRRFGIELATIAERTAADVLTLRLHIFHLLQTVSPNSIDSDVGVPARGLHGEAYRGHVFWDELFVLPVLSLRLPGVTRSLLLYRYRRLPAARKAAADAGFCGAMFPWQSGSDGREESQRLHLNPISGRWTPDVSSLQRHVGLAVAYTVWQYVESTDDEDFLAEYGAEMLIEIARFFSCLTTRDHTIGRFVIRGVMGPDEFHTGYPGQGERGIDNNAYTNVMVVWLLRRTLALLERLPQWRWEELAAELGVTEDEVLRWREITVAMFVPFHDGVISQFEGYERLERLDLEACQQRWGNIQRLDRLLEAEGASVNSYQVSKQADVLMLFYLLSAEELEDILQELGYPFDPATIPRTVDYYLARTSHGSTLSAVVHAWVLARSHRERALQFFELVLSSDITDIQQGTTAEGIHLGAMAGSVDLLQRCFTGLEHRDGVLWFNPRWPQALGSMRFHIWYKRAPLEVCVSDESVRVTSLASDGIPIRVGCGDRVAQLVPGVPVELTARPSQ